MAEHDLTTNNTDMDTKNPKTHVFLTLDEADKLNSKIAEAYVMADVLLASIRGNTEIENESLAWLSELLFCALSDARCLLRTGKEREDKGAPPPQAPAQGGAA